MKIKISKHLYNLAKIFGSENPLYVVGGYVRNSFLHLPSYDIDLASKLNVENLKQLLLHTPYQVIDKNTNLGTAIIKIKNQTYEYSTFRQESYPDSGAHSPNEIEFSESILQDASRRDFTVNCMYYDILKGELVDIYFGKTDIKNRMLKTVDTPEKVLCNDGIRVLRLIRFACELGFYIESATYVAANKYASNLADISFFKKREEFEKILYSKVKYKSNKTDFMTFREIKLLDELCIWQYLVDNSFDGNLINGIGAHLSCYKNVPLKYKLVALCLDISVYLNMYNDVIKLENFLKSFIGSKGLNFEKTFVKNTQECIKATLDLINLTDSDKIKIYLAKTYLNAKDYLVLIKALNKIKYKQILKIYHKMKSKTIPKQVSDLKITGDDIINCGVDDKKQICVILNKLFEKCVLDTKLNTSEKLITLTKEITKEGK